MDVRYRPLLLLSSLLIFVITTAFFLSSSNTHTQGLTSSSRHQETFTAPKQNIWAELSEAEAQQIYDFAYHSLPDLHLVQKPKSGRENSIHIVETLRPNKTDAVPYLFSDGKVPERWAKMVVAQKLDHEPHLVYYAVGPLPVSNTTQILPLTYPFNSGKNAVKSLFTDFGAIADFSMKLGQSISDITQDLLGATMRPNDPESLLCFPRPTTVTSSGLVLWFQFFRPGNGSGGRTLLPQGIYIKVDVSGSDQAKWTASQYFYNGIVYDSEEQFRVALASPDFVRTPPNLDDGSWTDTEDFDSAPYGREMPPPVTVQPYGPRYKLDRKAKHVSWFGFEFYLSTAQATGLSLFDIRFKGQRVMYELGLQEAMAHCESSLPLPYTNISNPPSDAGDDPMSGGQEFLDTFFGMGKNAFELLPGYDCPAYASYLDSHYHMAHSTHSLPNSICIFEFTADHLLSRHTAQYSITASRNTYLTVRTVSTVGNYDYAIDYIFYLDGTLEVKVRASGYIFAAFYRANHTEASDYGHRIHDAVSSSLHDHVINFKADMDIAGPSNEFIRLAIEPLTKSYVWDQPEVQERNTMHLVPRTVTHETGLDWPKNSGEFFLVQNPLEKNKWGEKKAYRVTSGTGMGSTPHLTVLNSTTLGDSARWAEHDVWVTKQKDTEPRSADPLSYLRPWDPIIDFNNIANGEGFEEDGEDMVVWFNLGAHHVPHSGDVPNTLMHTSASSVMFVPHNFLDKDASRESVQGVRVQLKGMDSSGGFAGEILEAEESDLKTREAKKQGPRMQYFGGTYQEGMEVGLGALEPGLEGFKTKMMEVTDLGFNGSAAGLWAN